MQANINLARGDNERDNEWETDEEVAVPVGLVDDRDVIGSPTSCESDPAPEAAPEPAADEKPVEVPTPPAGTPTLVIPEAADPPDEADPRASGSY